MTRFDLNSIVNSWTNTSSSFVNDIIISALLFYQLSQYACARVYRGCAHARNSLSCVRQSRTDSLVLHVLGSRH